jgi:hypothetical protein
VSDVWHQPVAAELRNWRILAILVTALTDVASQAHNPATFFLATSILLEWWLKVESKSTVAECARQKFYGNLRWRSAWINASLLDVGDERNGRNGFGPGIVAAILAAAIFAALLLLVRQFAGL